MRKDRIAGAIALVVIVGLFGFFFYNLGPVSSAGTSTVFEVTPGEKFHAVIDDLAAAHLVRSAPVAEFFAIFAGRSFRIQPGLYRLDPSMSTPAIVSAISGPSQKTVTVTIPEGSNIFQIDTILSNALVIKPGVLIAYAAQESAGGVDIEGTLFPDTYQFYTDSDVAAVVQKMTDDFNAKAAPLLPGGSLGSSAARQDITLASILEKEVPDQTDQEIVAGILLKRLNAGIPLDVDATVCYGMELQARSAAQDCATSLDLSIDSPYNTYLYKGFPPGPIGNPGLSAIEAALHPESSSYWYYLSDPKTGETIFSATLDEQHQNEVKYLDNG